MGGSLEDSRPTPSHVITVVMATVKKVARDLGEGGATNLRSRPTEKADGCGSDTDSGSSDSQAPDFLPDATTDGESRRRGRAAKRRRQAVAAAEADGVPDYRTNLEKASLRKTRREYRC